VNTTNYGFNLAGSSHELIACTEVDCRRGLDVTYGNDIKVVGGSYPDGIGAHLGFNMNVSGGTYIGYSSGNSNPLHFSGGDITVNSCTVVTKLGAIFEARTDAPQVEGRIALTDCNLVFDHTNRAGATQANLFSLRMPATAYDGTQDLTNPSQIVFEGNSVYVAGSAVTPEISPARLFTSGSATSAQFVGDIDLYWENNTYNSESASHSVKIVANKVSYLGAGTLNLHYKDAEQLGCYFGNAVASSLGAKLNLYARECPSSSIQADYGWLDEADARRAVFSSATGSVTYQTDSSWKTISADGTSKVVNTVANDTVLVIDEPSPYFNVTLAFANDINRSAKFAVDGDGAGRS
jgi:hypothetical protein